jgi:hypothetical protein
MLRRVARSHRQSATTKAAAVSFEKLENRQLMAVSPVIAGTKIKGINLSSGNISTNQTLITIPFTGNIKILDQTKLRLYGYAINPLSKNLAQIKKTVNVVKAEVLSFDTNNDGVMERNYLQITTDRLMRKQGFIVINDGALADDNNDVLATQTRRTIKGQNKERFTLANRNFVPTDFTRYTNETFSASTTPAAASTDIPEATVTANLDSFLGKKVTAGIITQAAKDAAMVRYNDANNKLKVPNANLRAALISLTGTFAAGAIDSFLSSKYTIIAFQDPGDSTVEVARTTAREDGKLRTVFRPEFDGEPFQVLSAWLAHEALHQDNTFPLQEEVAAVTFGTMVNAQQVLTDPAYIKTPSLLVNRENEKLLAFVNSGRTIFPYVGVLNGPNKNSAQGVLPGQKASVDNAGVYTSFNDYIRRLYIDRGSPTTSPDSDGNALLNTYYTAVTTKTAVAGMKFSNSIITDIDALQTPVYPRAAILVAQALRLTLS